MKYFLDTEFIEDGKTIDLRGLDYEWKTATVPQIDEHHALSDARWNKTLYEKIISDHEAVL